MPSSKYSLPPIVLYESHADRATSDFLIQHLPNLKKAGYTTICVDGMESGATLENSISMMKMLITIQTQKLSLLSFDHPEFHEENQRLRTVVCKLELLEAMKAHSFRLGGIDIPFIEQKERSNMDSIYRETTLTNNVLEEAGNHNGGIVVVLGFGHYTFQQMIQVRDKNAAQYLWFNIHNPDNKTLAYEEFTSKYSKEGYYKFFPLGIDIFKHSDPNLDTTFWSKLSAHCYNYEQKAVNTSTASILKSLIGPEVSAHRRKDGQYRVDALIPLNCIDKEGNSKASSLLRHLSNTLGDIKYEIANIHSEELAIIRGINEPKVAEQISQLEKSAQLKK